MISSVSSEELARGIKGIYRSDVSQAEIQIERYLEHVLEEHNHSEKLHLLERIGQEFRRDTERKPSPRISRSDLVVKLFSLFLGKKVSKVELSSGEFLERLAGSLNTVFDSLNEIIGVINSTLLGEQRELETIRQVIGSNLHQELGGSSLENYLAQIKKAFLTSHLAFQKAAQNKVQLILSELDPDDIAHSEGGGLKLRPLKKAGLFDAYGERYQKVRKWFESDRFTQDLLREFEKNCQSLYK